MTDNWNTLHVSSGPPKNRCQVEIRHAGDLLPDILPILRKDKRGGSRVGGESLQIMTKVCSLQCLRMFHSSKKDFTRLMGSPKPVRGV